MKEVRASLETLRPNRNLFVREWILGVDENEDLKETSIDLQLMLVHGSCATEQQFHLMLLSLEAKVQATFGDAAVRCFMFDAVGCAKSPVLPNFEDYNAHNMMEDIQAVVQKFLDAAVPLVWVGHSYGSSLILRLLASKRSELEAYKPRGLILLGTAVRPVPNDPSFLPDGGLAVFILPVFILELLQYFMTLHFTKLAIHPKHTWLRQACLAGSNANSCFMIRSFYRQTIWATMDDVVQVATPSVPVLAIHGADDGILPLKYAQQLVNAVPNGELRVVDEASHLVMMERADDVATTVLDYLQRHFLKEE